MIGESSVVHVTAKQFEQLVAEGFSQIPAELRAGIENVAIVIEAEPSAAVRAGLGLADTETLFGLYTGTPLTERTSNFGGMPDRIIIYRQPILDACDTPEQIRREVARTVIHEVAHHFGIDEGRLRELGWG